MRVPSPTCPLAPCHAAVELRTLANFNSLMAILAALGSASIHRLKGSAQKMGPKPRASLAALTQLMAHNGSHREYRAALAAARRNPPFVPYPGIHLTDLTFVADGNKDVVDGKLNVGKRQQVAAVAQSMLAHTGQAQQWLECRTSSTTCAARIPNAAGTCYPRSLSLWSHTAILIFIHSRGEQAL